MKKMLFVAVAGIFITASVNAQVARQTDPKQNVQRNESKKDHHKMMKDIDLSADQKSKLKDFNQNAKNQRDAIKNDPSLSQEQKQSKMKELHRRIQSDRKQMLTPDQQKKMKMYKKEHKKMNKKGNRRMKNPNAHASTVPMNQ